MKLKTMIVGGALVVLNLITIGNSSAGLGLFAPLIPLATITGHGGLYSAGLTGAALLRLKAAAALAALLTKSGFHFKIGHGWHPEDPAYHYAPSHGWGWHRRKRSVTEADARGDTAESPELAEYDPHLDDVLSYDQLGCGMRLVCELAATPYDELADDSKLILELFGRDGKAPDPKKDSRGKLTYSYASVLGSNSKDSSACSRVYSRCPYGASQILDALRSVQP